MTDKLFLQKLVLGAETYDNQRMHTNFQQDEILKFVEWMHKLYGYEYQKPQPKHRNEPWKVGT